MRILRTVCFAGIVIAEVIGAWAQSNVPILAPAARSATLAIAERLAVTTATPRPPIPAKDPFYPLASELDPIATPTLSDGDRLELISAHIHPTGSVELGGEPYLLFSEKRQKAGDRVTVSISGVEYEVEIVSIDKTRFRIRYNNLETTRSIK